MHLEVWEAGYVGTALRLTYAVVSGEISASTAYPHE